MTKTLKEQFSIIGHIEILKDDKGHDRHRFIPNSSQYLSYQLRKIPAKTELTCTFSKHVATRSDQQLRFYWAILGILADYTGDVAEELHECIMIDLYGTKKKKFNGKEYQIRQSISNRAMFPKHKMVELTNYVQEVCKKFEVKIPTKEELGYGSDYHMEGTENHKEFHKNLEVPDGSPTI